MKFCDKLFRCRMQEILWFKRNRSVNLIRLRSGYRSLRPIIIILKPPPPPPPPPSSSLTYTTVKKAFMNLCLSFLSRVIT